MSAVGPPRRILALTAHPVGAPATRFRVVAYRELLASRGIELTVIPFLDEGAFSRLYSEASLLDKARDATKSIIEQWRRALLQGPWDAVWVQREAALVGPPVLEYLLSSIGRIPLVYDFDDATWLSTAHASRHPVAARLLRFPRKAWWLMRRASHVIAGSDHLAEVASTVNPNVTVVPTVVSRETWTPPVPRQTRSTPVIGWIGTPGTARYLEMVFPALQRLRAEGRRFQLRLTGAGPELRAPLPHELVPWSLEDEIDAFRDLDIGLAPVADDEWGRGKCAFKQIQYFATGVPCVTSPVGPALDFVQKGAALAARSTDEWHLALSRLLDDPETRVRIVERARDLVVHELCTEIHAPRLAAILHAAGR